MRTAMPHGYRRSLQSGLLVPEEISRERQVWTADEGRLLDRAAKLLHRKGINLKMECQREGCQVAPLSKHQTPGGGFILRCEHADRVFTKAF